MSIAFIPSTAPFSEHQRAWLNGFFAGLLGSIDESQGSSPSPSVSTPTVVQTEEEEDFPWHDDSLPLEERLQLAEGKPIDRKLMAAMAQLDCGACGYICQTYSEAIARGEEKDLTRCSPGGVETAKALKEILRSGPIVETISNPAIRPRSHATVASQEPARSYDRAHPYRARLVKVHRLTHAKCSKDTRHIVVDLKDSGISYEPGDSLGVLPRNCPQQVGAIIDRLGATGQELVPSGINGEIPLKDALSRCWTISRLRKPVIEALRECAADADSHRLDELLQLEEENYPTIDLLHLLEEYPSARPDPRLIVERLTQLQPRLYSISSSPAAHPGEVHLTVGVSQYEVSGQRRQGVASGYLGLRSLLGDEVDVFIQPSHKFRLPSDNDTPIIMVGPGTGIAPFRAFLEQRRAMDAPGKNWLFFGNTSEKLDYLYRDELEAFADSGYLQRLDLAFSRDQAEKIYVQHRMIEAGRELWAWLQEGAYFYVCGDAKRMAIDVDQALKRIAKEHGNLTEESANEFVRSLAKAKRYLKDVY